MKRLPQILLIALLLSAGIAKAQSGTEVYEYATIVSYPWLGKCLLGVSFSTGEYKEIELDKNETKPFLHVNQTAPLKYIAQMTKEGWEITNAQFTNGVGWSYFFKRKQK